VFIVQNKKKVGLFSKVFQQFTEEYQLLDRVLKNENSFFRTLAYSFENELFAVLRPHLKHEN
jgi:hypothetical protein